MEYGNIHSMVDMGWVDAPDPNPNHHPSLTDSGDVEYRADHGHKQNGTKVVEE